MLTDRHSSRIPRTEAGFSLPELLVVIVMAGIMATAGYNLYREQNRINQAQQGILEVQSSGRAALQILIQAISHAGFGCSENIAAGNDVAGEINFINAGNNTFTGFNPDSITIVYGYENVANATSSINSTQSTVNVNTIANVGTSEYLKHICFYPSLSPNEFYEITSTSGSTITINPTISSLPDNSRIFRVNPIRFYINNGELRMSETDGVRDEPIAYDVQDFQIAYTTEEDDLSTATWEDNPASPRNVKAVWVYMILRTRRIEPGHQEGRTFRLPWDNGQTFNGGDLPEGFHYQEFQTQVWLRNAD